MLHVTSAAGIAITALTAQGGLRISRDLGSLSFSVVDAPRPADEVITPHGGCRVFIAPDAVGHVDDQLLDAEHGALGYRFTLYRRAE